MARKAKSTEPQAVSLAKFLSQKAVYKTGAFWIVGDMPLICHAWSEKAKREMLAAQTGATKPAKEKRDPHAEFLASLYSYSPGKSKSEKCFGFPVTAVKNAMLSEAHKDKGIPRETVMRSIWLEADALIRIPTAFPDAICDMPLARLWASPPEMREDSVKLGGFKKTASLAYRAQFRTWAIRLKARWNASVLNEEVIAQLIIPAGMSAGIGDWRNEKKGIFGSFHLASAEEEKAWEKFAAGKGPLPDTYGERYAMAAE